MALGYAFNNVCYPDTASVVEAFSMSFPRLDSGLIISAEQAYFSAPNAIYFWAKTQDTTTGVIQGFNSGVSVAVCNMSSSTTFDAVLAGQLFMFALTIVLGCWVLAKNAGLILSAIKRW